MIWNFFAITSHYDSGFLYLFVVRMAIIVWGVALTSDILEQYVQKMLMKSKWYIKKAQLINIKIVER